MRSSSATFMRLAASNGGSLTVFAQLSAPSGAAIISFSAPHRTLTSRSSRRCSDTVGGLSQRRSRGATDRRIEDVIAEQVQNRQGQLLQFVIRIMPGPFPS